MCSAHVRGHATGPAPVLMSVLCVHVSVLNMTICVYVCMCVCVVCHVQVRRPVTLALGQEHTLSPFSLLPLSLSLFVFMYMYVYVCIWM